MCHTENTIHAGKWTKSVFTNADIAALMSAIKASDNVNDRDVLFAIVNSKFPTTMNKYKLFQKAQQVVKQLHRQQETPRTSRKRNVISSNIKTFATKVFKVPTRQIVSRTPQQVQIFEDKKKVSTIKRPRKFVTVSQLKYQRKQVCTSVQHDVMQCIVLILCVRIFICISTQANNTTPAIKPQNKQRPPSPLHPRGKRLPNRIARKTPPKKFNADASPKVCINACAYYCHCCYYCLTVHI